MDPTNIQNMSMDDYENAHSELQEMLFDSRQIMDKITHEKNNLLELIDSLGLLEEDKNFALRKHYANVHKVENFTVKYKVTPELEQKRQELKDLLIHSLAGTSSSQISKQLTPEPNPPSGTITVRRLDKQGTTGPPIKLLKTTNDPKIVPIPINISTKLQDVEKLGGQSSSLVEIACSSTNYVSPSKNIVKIEPEHEKDDKEANEKDEKDSATGSVVEEAPWSRLFSENAESNASVLSELSLAQTGYKYNENGRCYRGYDEEFKKIYPEIQESKKGDRFFYCTVCRKDVCIGVSGTRGPIRLIQQHYDTIKHKKLAELAKKSDDAVYQALNPKAWGRYRSKFTKMWPEIKPSERGECYFYCTICERDLVIAQGISSVSNHLKTTRHLTNAQKKSGLTTTVTAMVNEDTPQKQLELIAAKQESMGEDIEDSFSHQVDLEASSSNQDFEPLQESEFTVPWVKVEPVIYEEETVET
uniref:Uncharacterized protein n=1 Tax=Acrobeloides nanus TaxID=290746 RepID=A0A914EK38_9BILA